MTKEYSDAWLIERAEASTKLLESLPEPFRGNIVIASATLPAMPASGVDLQLQISTDDQSNKDNKRT